MNLLFKIYEGVLRASYFAPWARPSRSDLNAPRKKFLSDDESVVWNIGDEDGACADHIEMAGFFASAILSYGKDKGGALRIARHLTVPKLRVQPNETGSSFSCNFDKPAVKISINGKSAKELASRVSIKGNLEITSNAENSVKITRTFIPAVNQCAH